MLFQNYSKRRIPKFIEKLKIVLEKMDNKKGDKKFIDFEIRGTKEDLDGLDVEIFSFDQINCDDYVDLGQENIKNALYCFTFNFNAIDEACLEKVKILFEQLKPMLCSIPIFSKAEFSFRNKGTRISFDFTIKEGKLVKAFIRFRSRYFRIS